MGPAATIASQVRTGRRRAVDVVAEALEAAEATHDDLNAFTLIDTSGAMHRAEAVDRMVAGGKDPGPLAGVPVGLKDIIDDAGLPTTSGGSFPSPLATNSATVVRRLGLAGAVIIGRTGLHEFAFGFTSENPWFGPVRNPWDPSTSPGGSSGGSGAAVAAGIVPLGIGTDTGGSVRVPAAMCGIYGLKVTHGRVPLTGVFPLAASLDTVGPLARTVEDLGLAYTAMAGDDPADPWSKPEPVEPPVRLDVGEIRLGVVRQWMVGAVSSEVREGMDRFVDLARSAGAEVSFVDDPSFEVPDSVGVAYGPEIWEVHARRFESHPERYGPETAERLSGTRTATTRDLLDALSWASAMRSATERLATDGIAALVAPTVGALTKTIGVDTIEIDGEEVHHRKALASFTAPINRIGVPALAGPVAGTPRQGVSVQLIGPMWSESVLLGVASALEGAGVFGVAQPPIFSRSASG